MRENLGLQEIVTAQPLLITNFEIIKSFSYSVASTLLGSHWATGLPEGASITLNPIDSLVTISPSVFGG